jgi:hypothetical protein
MWSDGTPGGATVASGVLSIDGARVTPTSTTGYGPGRVVEFTGTFAAAAFQNLGFGAGDNTVGPSGMYYDFPQAWAMFSTGGSNGPNLFARVNPGGDVDLGAGYVGTPHVFRVEWRADSVVFLIDGASVDRRAAAIAGPMRVGMSDFTAGGTSLQVDSYRMTPYAASGDFTSRVHDAGSVIAWTTMNWTASTPAGTALSMAWRAGPTPVPDGSWTAFTPVASSGSAVGVSSRYIQYRAQLSTSNPDRTPVLYDVGLFCCSESTPPVAVSDVAVERLALDSNGDATRALRVTFTAPVDAATIEVYRARFGNYPEYDDGASPGSVPPLPSYPPDTTRWTKTLLTASGQSDEVGVRDSYYYVVFSFDACGNRSAVSNLGGGVVNYALGDVHDGQFGHECVGDNVISSADISMLGSRYGITLSAVDPRACLDVGPTVTGSSSSRPLTDNLLNFEDLIIFSLGYSDLPGLNAAGRAHAERAAAAVDQLTLEAPGSVAPGEEFTVRLRYSGTGAVHGVSTQLAWSAGVAEILSVAGGDLPASQGGLVLDGGSGRVDAVTLGAGSGFTGEGVLAEVRFRALAAGDPMVRVASTIARDGSNHDVALGNPPTGIELPDGLPSHTRLGFAAPNPFRTRMAIQLAVARAQRVRLKVYDISGRVVRRLVDGDEPAGNRLVLWDGRDDHGRIAAAGMYVLRLEASEVIQNRRVQLLH